MALYKYVYDYDYDMMKTAKPRITKAAQRLTPKISAKFKRDHPNGGAK